MESLLVRVARRARGIVGIALTWGLAWIPFGFGIGMAAVNSWEIWSFHPNLVRALVMESFVAGALTGAGFSIVLAAIERRRKFGELTPRRFAVYGAIAGGAIAAIGSSAANLVAPGAVPIQWFLLEFALFASLGATSAAGSLAIARRGFLPETQERLLENGS